MFDGVLETSSSLYGLISRTGKFENITGGETARVNVKLNANIRLNLRRGGCMELAVFENTPRQFGEPRRNES